MTSYPRHITEQILRDRPQFSFVDLSMWAPQSEDDKGYNPTQPRDDHGRWTSGAGEAVPTTPGLHVAQAAASAVDALQEAGINFELAFSSRADPSNKDMAELRVRAITEIMKSGTQIKNAVLHLPQEVAVKQALIDQIGVGDVSRAQKEYANTPLCDLECLSKITVKNEPVSGQAVCHMGERSVTMGSTSVTGDFRHELGHAIHAMLGGKDGFVAVVQNSNDLTKFVEDRYDEAMAKAAKNPAGVKQKLTHEFYETEYGVIGKRALDNSKENIAEHYRGYHKAVYQSQNEDPKALDRYRERFPKWAGFWDAYYTAAVVAKRLHED